MFSTTIGPNQTANIWPQNCDRRTWGEFWGESSGWRSVRSTRKVFFLVRSKGQFKSNNRKPRQGQGVGVWLKRIMQNHL